MLPLGDLTEGNFGYAAATGAAGEAATAAGGATGAGAAAAVAAAVAAAAASAALPPPAAGLHWAWLGGWWPDAETLRDNPPEPTDRAGSAPPADLDVGTTDVAGWMYAAETKDCAARHQSWHANFKHAATRQPRRKQTVKTCVDTTAKLWPQASVLALRAAGANQLLRPV